MRFVLYCFQRKIGWRPRRRSATRFPRARGGDAASEMLEAVYQQIPTPVLLAFVVFIAHIIVITDTGAGVPIFFPIFKRCMRPFKPTVAYERLKSKYLIS